MYLWFTYGPSTDDDELLEKALIKGANGCRLTFSYGTHELQKKRADNVKRIAEKLNKPCLIIADLAGEKVRLGDFESAHIEIDSGETISFCPPEIEPDISQKVFPITSHRLFRQVQVGEKIIIGDGSLSLEIESVNKGKISAVAVNEGIVNPNRGITVQGSCFCPTSVTDKDISDLKFIAKLESFDDLALSLVSCPSDIIKVREILQEANSKIPIMAKIETVQGLQNLYPITEEVDFIIAARGDLALAMDWIELPAGMEQIEKVCREKEKPWILATQLVEGLERFIFPTRAEICDLASWLSRGVSGVMLSYETAFGKKPIEAITVVARMIERWGK